ncbi:unnamed protein product [Urochloa humidicola]
MSMLSSCTLLSLAPPARAPGNKFSPGTRQLRTKQPAASSPSVVTLPWTARCKVSRVTRFVCHAKKYNILPTALVHPPVADHDNWRINENKDHIILEFYVGVGTKASNLEVTTTKDEALNVFLVIRYTGDGTDGSLATSLDASLLMPPGYDQKNVMKAEMLRSGWLLIMIEKPKSQTEKVEVKAEN